MTAADWCAVMAKLDVLEEDFLMNCYADWLEEQGLPDCASAARRLPSLVGLVSDEMGAHVEWHHVDFSISRWGRGRGG